MRLAIISLGGRSSKGVVDEAKPFFDEICEYNIKRVEVHINGAREFEVLHKNEPIKEFDCLYIRGSHKYALLQRAIAEAYQGKCYMPLEPETFTYTHDKFLTTIRLQSMKIPVPKCYVAATTEAARSILEKVHFPIIMKLPQGTQGRGVLFADSLSSARTIIDTLDVFNQPYLIQEYVDTNATDVRAIVVGDRVVAAMRRQAKGQERRANIHLGGEGTAIELDKYTEEVAVRAAQSLGAGICGVDILEAGKPYVIEGNISPSLIGGISEATKINVAALVAKFLADKTQEFLSQRKKKEVTDLIPNGKDTTTSHELVTNISVKAGVMKLPPVVASMGGFQDNDEVTLVVKKGKVILKK